MGRVGANREFRLGGIRIIQRGHRLGKVLRNFNDRVDISRRQQGVGLLGAGDDPLHPKVLIGHQFGH